MKKPCVHLAMKKKTTLDLEFREAFLAWCALGVVLFFRKKTFPPPPPPCVESLENGWRRLLVTTNFPLQIDFLILGGENKTVFASKAAVLK